MIPPKIAALFRSAKPAAQADPKPGERRAAVLSAVLAWPLPEGVHVISSVCPCDEDVRVTLSIGMHKAAAVVPADIDPAEVPRLLGDMARIVRSRVPADPLKGTSFEIPPDPFGPPLLRRPAVPKPEKSRTITIASATVVHLAEIARRHAHLVAQLRRHAEADGNFAVLAAFAQEIEEIRELATEAEGALAR